MGAVLYKWGCALRSCWWQTQSTGTATYPTNAGFHWSSPYWTVETYATHNCNGNSASWYCLEVDAWAYDSAGNAYAAAGDGNEVRLNCG